MEDVSESTRHSVEKSVVITAGFVVVVVVVCGVHTDRRRRRKTQSHGEMRESSKLEGD